MVNKSLDAKVQILRCKVKNGYDLWFQKSNEITERSADNNKEFVN